MSVIKKVAFYTLGCKLNFSETSTISRDFQNNNYKIVTASKKADIYVINTCSVTQNADNKFKSVVKKMNRLNPNAFIVAIGCYAQLKPNELSDVKCLTMNQTKIKTHIQINIIQNISKFNCNFVFDKKLLITN